MSLNLPLSPADKKRIDRLKNRKGRNRPAKVPARLTRTAAFAPKRRGLITDSQFKRIYVVPDHSVVQVSGRELGSQHRDALYAVFRLPSKTRVDVDNNSPIGRSTIHVTNTTWRELINALGRTEHANNVATLIMVFEELMQVVMTVYEGPHKHIVEELKAGRQPNTPLAGKHIISEFRAEGARLDDAVTIEYGKWASDSMSRMRLVSLNADVQFRLKSDYAKSIWPYIDSMTKHTWVDESVLEALTGRDIWAEDETAATRRNFRMYCRKALDDMVRSNGLREWTEEIRGKGKKKTRRYHYIHALQTQMELELDNPNTTTVV